nr:DUF6325 family protein [Microbacterium bovistercoris]
MPAPVSFALGPVELIGVRLDAAGPDAGVIAAIGEQVTAHAVQVVDLVLVAVSPDGTVSWQEADGAEFELAGLRGRAPGLIGEDDIRQFARRLPAGGFALLVLLELVWLHTMAADLADAGGTVVVDERIPAPIVNAVLDAAVERSVAVAVDGRFGT